MRSLSTLPPDAGEFRPLVRHRERCRSRAMRTQRSRDIGHADGTTPRAFVDARGDGEPSVTIWRRTATPGLTEKDFRREQVNVLLARTHPSGGS